MGFRKLISFGDSSFVISLPKAWVNKYSLKKGDLITLIDEGTELRVFPHSTTIKKEPKEININFDGNLKDLKAQLFRSYIGDFNIMNIQKKGISTNYKDVKKLISDNFVGLDVIQTGNDKITVKDFLNLSEVSIYDLIRRVDRIVMSMFEDVREIISGNFSKINYTIERDDEVNKISNLLIRVLKKAINPNDRKILDIEMDEVFYYWEIITSIEEIADQLKRMIRPLSSKLENELIILYDEVYENYKKVMKANFTKDLEFAISLMNTRKPFSEKCEQCASKLDFNSSLIIEKIKLINNHSGNIARSYIKLGFKN